MRLSKHIRFISLLALLLALIPLSVFAQSSNGSISGTVTDDTGAALPGVTVTSANLGTGSTRTVVTNNTGHYEIALLPPGKYSVAAQLEGFQPQKAASVTVNVGTDTTWNVKLRTGISESVTVTAAAPLVETTRSEVSSVVNETAITNLPTNGRNFIDFVLTTPGVVRDPRSGDISFAGQRGTLNSVVVDGADNNNTFFGQSLGRTGSGRAPYQFSQDAVKEFQVNANAYSAEYGRAGGAVINVITKSGTNELQGSVFDFYRDKKYRSLDYLNQLREDITGVPAVKPPYHFNQYGFSVGGPIVHDRHFFFANYDAQRNSIPNTTSLGINSIPSTVSAADLPAAQAAFTFLQGKAIPYDQKQNQDVYLIKTDHELFSNDHLSLRFNRQAFTGENFENGGLQSSPEHTGNSLVNTNTFSLTNTTVLSSSLFNEVRGQYAKDREPGAANSADPEATIRQGAATVLVIGRNSFSPRETTLKRTQLADSLTYVLSNHTFKGGFDWNQDKILNFFPGNFSGVYTFNSLADFQNKKPASYLQNFAGEGTTGGTTHPNLTDSSLFLEDEWQLTPAVTLNLGIRYDKQDIEQPTVQNPDAALLAAGLDTSRIHEDGNNIAPRLGIAWTPSSRTVVRAGYGVFYGRTPAIMVGTAHSQNGIQVLSIQFPATLFPTYPGRYETLPASLRSLPQNIFVFDPNFENPKVQQSSFGVEQGVGNDYSVGLSYQYVKGDDLPRTADINVASPVTVTSTVNGQQVSFTRYTAKRFPTFNRVLEFQSTAHSKYNGATIDIQKRFSHNWQARLAYTYSQAKDDRPDATIVVPGTDDAREAQDALNLGSEWAYSDTDVRNRVVLSGVWNLAYADHLNGFARAFLGGWSLSGIISYQSGQPFTPVVTNAGFTTAINDLNNDGNRANDRVPGVGRNSLRKPSQTSIDPRLTKDIPLRGDLHLQLIAEAFNLTNKSNVSNVRNTAYTYNIGTNVFTPASSDPLTGYLSPSAVAGPRTYQFAAKFLF
jgi:outer membrane receptor protein involved in Fe transport